MVGAFRCRHFLLQRWVDAGRSHQHHRPVLGVDDVARDAAEERALQARQAALAHDDRRRVELLGRCRDELGCRSVGLQQQRLCVEARVAGDRDAGVDDVVGVSGAADRRIDASAGDRLRDAEAALGRLLRVEDRRCASGPDENGRGADRALSRFRAVEAEDEGALRIAGAHGGQFNDGAGEHTSPAPDDRRPAGAPGPVQERRSVQITTVPTDRCEECN